MKIDSTQFDTSNQVFNSKQYKNSIKKWDGLKTWFALIRIHRGLAWAAIEHVFFRLAQIIAPNQIQFETFTMNIFFISAKWNGKIKNDIIHVHIFVSELFLSQRNWKW